MKHTYITHNEYICAIMADNRSDKDNNIINEYESWMAKNNLKATHDEVLQKDTTVVETNDIQF